MKENLLQKRFYFMEHKGYDCGGRAHCMRVVVVVVVVVVVSPRTRGLLAPSCCHAGARIKF